MLIKKLTLCVAVATLLASGVMACSEDEESKHDKTENPQNQVSPDNPSDSSTNNQPDNNPEARPCKLGEATTPIAVRNAMGMGWNLGNQFDAYDNGVSSETAWSQPVCTQQTFNKVAAAGIKTVRIPITWMGHIGEAPDYKIDDAWLNRIYEVVGYAEKAGLNAIINIHHDGSNAQYWLNIKECANNVQKQNETIAKLSAIWKQIATKFAEKGHFLVFEALNEIQDGGWGWGDNRNDGGRQYNAMNEWLKAIVEAIRSTGGNNSTRWIGVPAYNTDIDLSEHLVLPDDPAKRLMVSIHYYAPYEYTLEYQYQQWGQDADKSKTTNYGQESYCQEQMKKLNDRYISKGIPVYIGEMGNVNRGDATSEKFRAYYFEFVAKCMHDNGMPAILWDNGVATPGKESHGYFHHGNGEWMNEYSEQMVKTLVKAMSNN